MTLSVLVKVIHFAFVPRVFLVRLFLYLFHVCFFSRSYPVRVFLEFFPYKNLLQCPCARKSSINLTPLLRLRHVALLAIVTFLLPPATLFVVAWCVSCHILFYRLHSPAQSRSQLGTRLSTRDPGLTP